MQDFPSKPSNNYTPTLETDEITKEELLAIEKLEHQTKEEEQEKKKEQFYEPQLSPPLQSPSQSIIIESITSVTPPQSSPTVLKPSFLEAAKARKAYLPTNLPVKNSKTKGKQLVLLSNAGRRAYK